MPRISLAALSEMPSPWRSGPAAELLGRRQIGAQQPQRHLQRDQVAARGERDAMRRGIVDEHEVALAEGRDHAIMAELAGAARLQQDGVARRRGARLLVGSVVAEAGLARPAHDLGPGRARRRDGRCRGTRGRVARGMRALGGRHARIARQSGRGGRHGLWRRNASLHERSVSRDFPALFPGLSSAILCAAALMSNRPAGRLPTGNTACRCRQVNQGTEQIALWRPCKCRRQPGADRICRPGEEKMNRAFCHASMTVLGLMLASGRSCTRQLQPPTRRMARASRTSSSRPPARRPICSRRRSRSPPSPARR